MVLGEEGSGSGGGDYVERYNDDWPGYGPHSSSNNKPSHNPASNPPKPPRVREKNGEKKWSRNNGHRRDHSSAGEPTFSILLLLSLPLVVTVAPVWR